MVYGPRNTQHNDTKYNDIYYYDTEHNDIPHINKYNITFCVTIVSIIAQCCYAISCLC
jgi:hypothetical protein